jgi:hypothetical protein
MVPPLRQIIIEDSELTILRMEHYLVKIPTIATLQPYFSLHLPLQKYTTDSAYPTPLDDTKGKNVCFAVDFCDWSLGEITLFSFQTRVAICKLQFSRMISKRKTEKYCG